MPYKHIMCTIKPSLTSFIPRIPSHLVLSMTLKSSMSSSAVLRTLAPKPTENGAHKHLTIEQKRQLLEKWTAHANSYRVSLGTEDLKFEPSRSHFEETHGLGRGTLAYLLKISDQILMVPETSQNRVHARAEVRPFYPVETVVVRLIDFLRDQNVSVDVWLLRLLAMIVYDYLVAKFGEMTFEKPKFSKGWAQKFMRFWGFSRHKLQGEAAAVNWSEIKKDVENLQRLISTYNLKDVYNADETGLFLQTASDWTLDRKKKAGAKTSASRVSILFCTNATGTDKVKPFILSESFPQGFKYDHELQKKVDFVHWQHSKRPVVCDPPEVGPIAVDNTAESTVHDPYGALRVTELADTDPKRRKRRADYMNTYTFYYWLLLFQKHVSSKDPQRQVLLLVDNCSCHQKAADIAKEKGHIPNITVEYLPKNSTSVTQPLDAGIIAVFKMRYKEFITVNLTAKFLCEDLVDADADADTDDDADVDETDDANHPGVQPPGPSSNPRKDREKKQKTKKKKVPKISNLEGWQFIFDSWDMVRPEAIRHCFHHVPIIGKDQKELLDCLTHNAEVADALQRSQQNTLTRVRNLVGEHALAEEDTAAADDTPDGWSGVSSSDDQDNGDDDNDPEDEQNDTVKENAVNALNTPNHLSFLISKLFTGMPILEKIIAEESKDNPFFASKFKIAKTSSQILESDDLLEDDSSDEDFAPSPLKTHLFLKSDRGSPLKMNVVKLTRASSFNVKLLLAESSVDSGSDTEVKQVVEVMSKPAEDFNRGRIHEKLMEAAALMKMLPPPASGPLSSVDLIADSLLTHDYTDAASNIYFKKFITEQAKILANHQLERAKVREKRRAEKKKLDDEKEKVQAYFPGRKRSRPEPGQCLPAMHFTEVEE